MEKKFTVFVFARLKPSQINYKIIPLSNSPLVERVYVLRKTPLEVNNEKVECIALPKILRIRLFYWLFTALYGAWLIRKKGANVIVSYNIFPHGFNGYVASLITGKPFIFAEINEETLNYFSNSLFNFFIKKILNRATYITVPGANTAKRWRINGYNNLVPLHSTINTEVFLPFAQEKWFDFLFIGEFDDNKRPNLILEAFTEIRKMGIDASLCFIGFGQLEKNLKELIKKNNLTQYVSVIKTNNVLEYLLNSKVLVMSSLSEGIPCAMLESMACELIVVVPPVGDIADVVEHGVNGFLHNNTKEDIVKWMVEAYKNYDSLGLMREKARDTIIKGHSYQFAVAGWNKLLMRIKG
ncbi:MAG: glycosyltransferase [Bacteroidales bacterium]|nr:glycosyltransferase [Bacteroidales bacterium]